MNNNTRITLGRKIAIAMVVAATGLAPAVAFATNGVEPAQPEDPAIVQTADLVEDGAKADEFEDFECVDCMTNEEYVKSLKGLTDEEKAELIELYDAWDALGEDEVIPDEQWDRARELEEKAYLSAMRACLTDDEYQEFLALYEKDAAVQKKVEELYEREGLTEDEWNRMDEFYSKCYA